MKKIILTLFLAIMATTGLYAQQISVVSPGGETSLYRTFPEAIRGADPGSVIYLPGGGFSISDEVKIIKKLTIIGIGHYAKNGNVDGVTTISGNLFFNAGSSGSAVLGCYITGDVVIGEDAAVDDVCVKYCNLNSLQVKNANCTGTFVNQNYIRGDSNFSNSVVTITNNLFNNRLFYINGGVISCNVFAHVGYWGGGQTLMYVNNVGVTYNIFRKGGDGTHYGSNIQTRNNFTVGGSWGDLPVIIDAEVNDIFVDVNNWSISPNSSFHFKDNYIEYENQVGIYAGDGFKDDQLAPVPYIVAKRVDEQTDASGRLNVKIRVKAGD